MSLLVDAAQPNPQVQQLAPQTPTHTRTASQNLVDKVAQPTIQEAAEESSWDCWGLSFYLTALQNEVLKFVIDAPTIATVATVAFLFFGVAQLLSSLLVAIPMIGIGVWIGYTLYTNRVPVQAAFDASYNRQLQPIVDLCASPLISPENKKQLDEFITLRNTSAKRGLFKNEIAKN